MRRRLSRGKRAAKLKAATDAIVRQDAAARDDSVQFAAEAKNTFGVSIPEELQWRVFCYQSGRLQSFAARIDDGSMFVSGNLSVLLLSISK
ncbi:hypothetical protein CL653_00275 [bacterium]|nr:hypothetical protein [bacterium]|tara:strand:- start:30 stop:302 length:273 start_codon:yes stop_codon:yes gene_type:complete